MSSFVEEMDTYVRDRAREEDKKFEEFLVSYLEVPGSILGCQLLKEYKTASELRAITTLATITPFADHSGRFEEQRVEARKNLRRILGLREHKHY
ncbi:MAG: hypothetical protein COB04_16250 [Gammaproteobacteria bacterium]|nr:MAG: hypothetical protein COB04_16250 [Gammaproteobacteria bacterium]